MKLLALWLCSIVVVLAAIWPYGARCDGKRIENGCGCLLFTAHRCTITFEDGNTMSWRPVSFDGKIVSCDLPDDVQEQLYSYVQWP